LDEELQDNADIEDYRIEIWNKARKSATISNFTIK
jgi:hypothetical protein